VDPLDLVKLRPLMARTTGSPEVRIGFIDGPVMAVHPALAVEQFRQTGTRAVACTSDDSEACVHGTFVAGILSGRRGATAPAICPNCTLLIRPVFAETSRGQEHPPRTTALELAAAIIETIDAGARIISLSLGVANLSEKGMRAMTEALDHAVYRGVIVVAAAGNQGTLGSSAITRHPWVIPVVACDLRGHPADTSNLGSSIGRRGLTAPGIGIASLGAMGRSVTLSGTSVAVPFVSGAIALLWSEFLHATAADIKLALARASAAGRASVVPPLLDAWGAYRDLKTRPCGFSGFDQR